MKHKTWLNIAKEVAKESKCVSLSVGTVLVKNGHLISTGVNGTPKGYKNCNEVFSCRCPEHHEWSNRFEIHSEMSAIVYCPVSTEGSIIYITHSPCFNCCKHLIAAGIKAIYFMTRYHRMTEENFKEIVDFCKFLDVKLTECVDVNCEDTWIEY